MHVSIRTWQDNINMGIKGIEFEGLDSIHRTQDNVQWQGAVNTIMKLYLPQTAGNSFDQLREYWVMKNL
jgi:hypothetical protein